MSGRTFSAWQIELTTRCPLKCVMCARAGADSVAPRDMSISDLRKIAPYMKSVEAVVLEGLGGAARLQGPGGSGPHR